MIPLVVPEWKTDRPPFWRPDGMLGLAERPKTGVVARAAPWTKDDGTEGLPASGIMVDRRVLAVRPSLTDAEALTLDWILKSYERQSSAAKVGVTAPIDEIAETLGVSLPEAAALKATLIGRGLLREGRNGFGMASGLAPCLPATTVAAQPKTNRNGAPRRATI